MSKQDRQGSRTPADLERRYEFGKALSNLEAMAKTNSEQIAKQGQRIDNVVGSSDAQITAMGKSIANAEKKITSLDASVGSLQIRMTNAEKQTNEVDLYARRLELYAKSLEVKVNECEKKIENIVLPESATSDLLVTVVSDTLESETLASDKTFAEIEGAISSGINVRVKLHISNENRIIFLHLSSYQEGVEACFLGYVNGKPLSLQILADETSA